MRTTRQCILGFVAAAGVAAGAHHLSSPAQANLIGAFHPNLGRNTNSLFIFGAPGVTGTISNNASFNTPFTIPAAGVIDFIIPLSEQLDPSNTVLDRALFINSADPISALALNRAPATTDMTFLHDTDSLGTEFRVLGFSGTFGEGAQMSVTATEDNTEVTITPTANLSGGQTAGTPFVINLNAGESMKFNAPAPAPGNDLTGSLITADNPVAVFAGAACTQVPHGTIACDHIISQLPSADNFGTEFVVPETSNTGPAGNLVRILAHQDNTEVTVNGVLVATLNAGQFHEIANANDLLIETSNPALVGQYLKGTQATGQLGDPAFSFIPSVDQLLDEYVFSTPIGTQAFTDNFLNIAIDTAALGSLTLNGVLVDPLLFSPFGAFSVGNVPVPVGAGTILADVPFFASVSGFDFADSYHTLVGATFTPGASPPPPPPPPVTVPEPTTLALFGIGVGMLGFMMRRRQRGA